MGILSKGSGSKNKGTKKNSKGRKKGSKSSNNKKKSAKRKENRKSLTQTKSNSHAPTPDKDKKKDQRIDDYKEKEQDAADDIDDSCFKDSHLLNSNSHMAKPKKIELKHRGVDSATMTRVFEKYKRGEKERSEAQQSVNEMDEKSKILLDRVTKKHASIRNKQGELSDFFIDDPSGFSKAPKKEKKKIEESVCFEDDSYTHYPRLFNVRRLPAENIYTEKGVPFWAEYLEPTDDDMKDVAEPISISSGHLEMYHNKELVLRKIESTNVVLNTFQPLCDLMRRDEVHFDYRLVFSNTICSLVNILDRDVGKEVKKSKEKTKNSEKKISFDVVTPSTIVYSRINPIASIRSIRSNMSNQSTPPTTTTTTSSRDEAVIHN